MIMCEWHQLVYFAHHHNQQADHTSRFSLHITRFFGKKANKMSIFRPKINTKNYTYFSSTFNPNICSKVKTLLNTADLKVGTWYLTGIFPLNVFRGLYFSYLSDPVLRTQKNSGYLSHSAIEELLLFPFHRFVYKCRAIQY